MRAPYNVPMFSFASALWRRAKKIREFVSFVATSRTARGSIIHNAGIKLRELNETKDKLQYFSSNNLFTVFASWELFFYKSNFFCESIRDVHILFNECVIHQI